MNGNELGKEERRECPGQRKYHVQRPCEWQGKRETGYQIESLEPRVQGEAVVPDEARERGRG